MTGPVLIGLAVCSHDAAIVTGAEFSNIAFTGNVTGTWQIAEIGVAQPTGNSVEGLYLTVKDSSGKSKTVVQCGHGGHGATHLAAVEDRAERVHLGRREDERRQVADHRCRQPDQPRQGRRRYAVH